MYFSCVVALNISNRSSSSEAMIDMVRVLAKQRVGLNVCHINAQSLLNKIDEVRVIFENSAIDVICISETWLNESISDNLVSLNGYKLFRSDRKELGGGVSIYIRDCISCKYIAKNGDEG